MAKGGYQKRRIAEKKQRERQARKRAERNKKILTGLIVVVVLALIGGITFVALTGDGDLAATPTTTPTPTPAPSATFSEPCTKQADVKKGQKTFANPPCKIITDGASYTATFRTSKGTVVVDLLPAEAPVTVNNFVFLARAGYYNNSIFHRVIPDFGGPDSNMVQGGDAGGPGYQFGDENTIPITESGLLAMANAGPGTNGSQFFLLDGPVSHLNNPDPAQSLGTHSIFGRVTSGLKVIDAIASVKRVGEKPAKDVVLRKVTIKETAG